ncbi:MAG: hypothetical protein HY722_03560 [Planctomycetes bacterium]|nr:hypothetical protein [Planctomycetota bacterium]
MTRGKWIPLVLLVDLQAASTAAAREPGCPVAEARLRGLLSREVYGGRDIAELRSRAPSPEDLDATLVDRFARRVEADLAARRNEWGALKAAAWLGDPRLVDGLLSVVRDPLAGGSRRPEVWRREAEVALAATARPSDLGAVSHLEFRVGATDPERPRAGYDGHVLRLGRVLGRERPDRLSRGEERRWETGLALGRERILAELARPGTQRWRDVLVEAAGEARESRAFEAARGEFLRPAGREPGNGSMAEWRAARALGRMGDPRALPALEARLEELRRRFPSGSPERAALEEEYERPWALAVEEVLETAISELACADLPRALEPSRRDAEPWVRPPRSCRSFPSPGRSSSRGCGFPSTSTNRDTRSW